MYSWFSHFGGQNPCKTSLLSNNPSSPICFAQFLQIDLLKLLFPSHQRGCVNVAGRSALAEYIRIGAVAGPGQIKLKRMAGSQHVSFSALYQVWIFSSSPSTSFLFVFFGLSWNSGLYSRSFQSKQKKNTEDACLNGSKNHASRKKVMKFFQSTANRPKFQVWLLPKHSQQNYTPISYNSTPELVSLEKTEGIANSNSIPFFSFCIYACCLQPTQVNDQKKQCKHFFPRLVQNFLIKKNPNKLFIKNNHESHIYSYIILQKSTYHSDWLLSHLQNYYINSSFKEFLKILIFLCWKW